MVAQTTEAGPILRLSGIEKAFGPVQALAGVDLEVRQGEVHALIGENGAGKSTLMKILSGALLPDRGAMLLAGRGYAVRNPAQGRSAGIAMIYQELTLAPHLTVEENITLGVERSRFGFVSRATARVREVLMAMGHADLDPACRVGTLSMGLQQVVEIARALFGDARLIVMDEPTSSLSAEDARKLFDVVRRVKERGVSVIYITHFLEEVPQVCDRFTVLRDGHTVATGDVKDVTIRQLIGHMVGRELSEMYPRRDWTGGETVLTVRGLRGRPMPADVSFELRRGEILGISGLVGSGRSETVRALFGLEPLQGGTLVVAGRPEIKVTWLSPVRALGRGFDLLSENRKEEGLAQRLPIAWNVTLSGLNRYRRAGLISLRREQDAAADWCRRIGIRLRDVRDPVSSLSGGNQQKVAVARLLHHDSDILFLDEPTRGIDVGSKAEIYQLIHELARQGKAVVVISSYLPELMGICDTLAVMHRGRMSRCRPVKAWTEQDVMAYATSGGAV